MEETKLPLKWMCDGFQLEQVWREGDLAIYSQSKYGRVVTWEAVHISHLPETTLPNGKVIGPREKYPKPSQWGKLAWSCITLERAKQRLENLRHSVPIPSNSIGEGVDTIQQPGCNCHPSEAEGEPSQ